jgi:radical SAM protein (TIGR01212 family)
MIKKKRYSDYNAYLRELFGERVQKISIDAGLSCPNRDGRLSRLGCIYCNEKGSGSGLSEKGLSIKQQIEAGKIGSMKKYKAKKFLAYFQSYSNTYTTVDHMKALYDEALSCEGMVGMAIGTRPDCIDPEKLDLIQTYTQDYLVWIEYGLQSVHDDTLKRINRGHSFLDFSRAVDLTRNRGIQICTHVILGLPGENREMMLETARTLADGGINGIKIHLLYVIKGTPLEKLWQRGEYRPMEQAEYVEMVCDFLELLPKHIIIQRITGDPHPDELRAPLWAARYRETFNLIQDLLEARDTFQGKYYIPGR